VPLLDAVAKIDGWTGLLTNNSIEIGLLSDNQISWRAHTCNPKLTIEHRTCNHMNCSKSSSTVCRNRQEPTALSTNLRPS
jgi:hypothetical protein